MNCQICNRRKR